MQSEWVSDGSGLFTPSLPYWDTVYHWSFQAAKHSEHPADRYLLDLHVFSNSSFPLSCLSSRSSALIGRLLYIKRCHERATISQAFLWEVFVLGYQSLQHSTLVLVECGVNTWGRFPAQCSRFLHHRGLIAYAQPIHYPNPPDRLLNCDTCRMEENTITSNSASGSIFIWFPVEQRTIRCVMSFVLFFITYATRLC